MFEVADLSYELGDFSLGPINLQLHDKDYCVILGPSGAGKSQLLYLLAGLVKPGVGRILYQHQAIRQPADYAKWVGLLFQQYALFPHLSVWDNVVYGLKARKIFTNANRKKAVEWMKQLNVMHLSNRRINGLSGGEQQRIALARTLVLEPRILLLDEPLAAVDAPFRRELRTVLKRIHQKGMLVIHVTHDYEEALALATQVAIMEQGQVTATGSPEKVFSRLNTGFVARLLGEVNIFEVMHTAAEQGVWTWKEKHTGWELKSLPFSSNGFGKILVRTRDVLLAEEPFSSSVQNMLKGTVEAYLPASGGVHVSVDAGLKFHLLLSEKAAESLRIKPGKTVYVAFKASAVQPIG